MAEANIQELFDETLKGDYEDESPWQAVHKLRQLGTREVFEVARKWCSSEDPLMRARGADVLAQLGKTWEHPTNSFPEESYSVVATLLMNSEQHSRPLVSAIAALGHLDDPRAIALIAPFHSHPDPEIRFSVACALGSFPNDPLCVKTLLALMQDADEDVRDWATFGLVVLGDADSSEIREALVRALSDLNKDVREEAVVGSAKRKELRVLTPLLTALEQSTVSDRIIEAAYTLLGMETDRKDWSARDYAAALEQRFPPVAK
jgi:HEAT repeat protein